MKLGNRPFRLVAWGLAWLATDALAAPPARLTATPTVGRSAFPPPRVQFVGDRPDLLEGSDTTLRIQRLHVQPLAGGNGPLNVGDGAVLPAAPAAAAPPSPGPGSPALPLEAADLGVNVFPLLEPAFGDIPLGTPDHYAVANDAVLSIPAPGFLANDIDLQGEALTGVSIADNVDHGTLAAVADGSFTYTPDTGFTGTDSFSYRMKDASNHFSDPVEVVIEVLPPANRTPLGFADEYAVRANTPLSIPAPGFLANDVDPDGEAVSAVSIADNVDHGTLAAFADGSFTYTPDSDFTGIDSFSYRIKDASNHFSDPVVVTLVVSQSGRSPLGFPDAYSAVINTPLLIAAPGFLANDLDLDGEAISAVSIEINVKHGTLAAFANGTFSYTPDAGFTGTDIFAYRMRDASDNLAGPILVTIEVHPDGTLPVGTPDHYAVPSDRTLSLAAPGFLANDIDLNGEALSAVSIQDNVDHGTLSAFADGRFTYTPDSGFTGTDSFTYRMRDASNNFSDPVLVTIDVLPPANRVPIGTPDTYSLLADTTLSIPAPGFLLNDSDPDGEALSAVSIQDNVDHGTLAAFADGRFTYTPDPGFTGTDSFAYRMRDDSNHFSDPILVTLEVIVGNRTPTGVSDAYTAVKNTPLSIPAPGFLANDFDLDGDAVSAVSIQNNVDHGSLSAFADGRFTYTPQAGFAGTDGFSYRIRDDENHFSDPIPVTITVVDPDHGCVDDLIARAKSGLVQLVWTHAGAHHYNVYRATSPAGPFLQIGVTASTYSMYTDTAVVNGTTYYYTVREANFSDVERCESNTASARPRAR